MGMISEKELLDSGVSKEELTSILKRREQWEKGTPPLARSVRRLGRPPLSREKLVPLTVRIPESQREQLDEQAHNLGKTTADFVREAISDKLLATV